jgi:tRNA-specific 2-thiouridylase
MSGGVDSSVAAALAVQDGLECVGVTLKLFGNDDVAAPRESACCSLADAEDARRVAYALGVPHYVFDFSEDFRRDVIGRFVGEYMGGRTPNPCIDCNRFIKFRRLMERMAAMGFDYTVTGHYARVSRDAASGRWLLMAAADAAKDQSYVLYAMTQAQLAHTLFPLGGMKKAEVRSAAAGRGFVNAKKRESQDICFVPEGRYADFISRCVGEDLPEGDFIDAGGRVLGRHRGLARYTVGQRRGLGLALPAPLYVLEKRVSDNTVVLAPERDLYSRALEARDINLIACGRLERPLRVAAKLRYGQAASPATAEQTGEDRLRVEFDEAQRAVAGGQSVVLYDGDIVVGGGVIV